MLGEEEKDGKAEENMGMTSRMSESRSLSCLSLLDPKPPIYDLQSTPITCQRALICVQIKQYHLFPLFKAILHIS